MSIKKSLFALAAMALAMMGFASSAMAVDGVIKDVTNEEIIPETRVIHLTGWAKFEDTSHRGVECHATSNVTPTNKLGTTGHATFSVPDVKLCTTIGITQCTVTAVHVTNSPYHVTVTTTDFDITGTIVIHTTLSGLFCPSDITVTFSEITATILKTGETKVTGSNVKQGGVGTWGDKIAGVTIEGGAGGQTHSILGTDTATAHGQLMITEGADLCTWKLT